MKSDESIQIACRHRPRHILASHRTAARGSQQGACRSARADKVEKEVSVMLQHLCSNARVAALTTAALLFAAGPSLAKHGGGHGGGGHGGGHASGGHAGGGHAGGGHAGGVHSGGVHSGGVHNGGVHNGGFHNGGFHDGFHHHGYY